MKTARKTFEDAENRFQAADDFATEHGFDFYIRCIGHDSVTRDFIFGCGENIPTEVIPKGGTGELFEVYQKTGVFEIGGEEKTVNQSRYVDYEKSPETVSASPGLI